MGQPHIGVRMLATRAAVLVLIGTATTAIANLAPPRGLRSAPAGASGRATSTVTIRLSQGEAHLAERERFVVERLREARTLHDFSDAGTALPAPGLEFVFVDENGRRIDRFDGVRGAGHVVTAR